MLKAIIIDDEQGSRETLEHLIKDFCKDVEIVAMADGVESGISCIKQFQPDVVFLDIEMNSATGFDLLRKFDDIFFDVIFTTAYSNYAIKAFKFSAVDFLLKPIDIDDLRNAVDKVRNRKQKENHNSRFELMMHNIKQADPEKQRLAISTMEGLVFINAVDIIRLEADGAYTGIFQKNGQKMITSKDLKLFEEILDKNQFVRVHNSHIINLSEVQKYVKGEGGYVVLSDGSHVDISKRRKEHFLSKINKV